MRYYITIDDTSMIVSMEKTQNTKTSNVISVDVEHELPMFVENRYMYENGKIVDTYDGASKIHFLRNDREPLLLAFDKWKSNVAIGFEVADEETLAEVHEWYLGILDLDTVFFKAIPACIQKYL